MTEKHLPKVSIVTPSFNQGQYLEATIRSVLTQDYPNLEYLIVDGGSKDNSVEIIKRYDEYLAWWCSEKDKGHADGLNKGFRHANGDILAWLNSDDEYTSSTVVSEAVSYLNAHPEVGMVYAGANLTDEKGAVKGQFSARQTSYRQMLDGRVHIPQATTFWRADLFRKVGPLDPGIAFAFDYDFWVRLAKVSEIHYVPRVWANFRLHDLGKSIVLDDRCYPDMLMIRERELGKGMSILHLRWFVRRFLYAPLPWQLRLWLRKRMTF